MNLNIRTVFLFLPLAVILQIFPASIIAAEPWTEPAHWGAVGPVNKWIDLDAQFNQGRKSRADLRRSNVSVTAR